MDNNFNQQYGFSKEEWESCLKVLNSLKNAPLNNPANDVFGGLVTKIYKTAKKQIKDQKATNHKEADIAILKQSKIADNALAGTSNYSQEESEKETSYSTVSKALKCYVCKDAYRKIHSFYHRLCPSCATHNLNNRKLSLDLTGRVVILTGGRVKIGYAAALKFLKANATLIVTTRFPALALAQFSKEKDYSDWKDNLAIYGLDLRNLKAVQSFIDYFKTNYEALDILVNNAAQTIKYPDTYYLPLLKQETQLLTHAKPVQLLQANVTPIADKVHFLDNPIQKTEHIVLNRFSQPVDLREKNSWNSTLEEISTYELLEVNLINHIAPYILIKELTPLFKSSNFPKRFIINVTSSEGLFNYPSKTHYHPHTNMTKAALNMLTRTSAQDYVKNNIYMNSVDVGWVSTGVNESYRIKQFEQAYIPPLDPVDGAARIIHPIFEALVNKYYFYGQLVKDYQIVDW